MEKIKIKYMSFTFLKSKTFWASVLAGVIALVPALQQAGMSNELATAALSFLVAFNRVLKDF